MPNLVDVATLRQHVETDLSDAAVQRLLDDADARIVERHGPHAGPLTIDVEGGDNVVFLPRAATAITSVTEYADRALVAGVLLAANDYRTLYDGRAIERLVSGTNGRSTWGERIVVVYTVDASTAKRTLVEIELVKLAAKYEGLRDERIGDYGATHVEYTRERERLLRSLRTGLVIH